LVPSESSRRGGVHGLGFVAFGPTVEKLCIFKVFMSYKNFKNNFYLHFACGNDTRAH